MMKSDTNKDKQTFLEAILQRLELPEARIVGEEIHYTPECFIPLNQENEYAFIRESTDYDKYYSFELGVYVYGERLIGNRCNWRCLPFDVAEYFLHFIENPIYYFAKQSTPKWGRPLSKKMNELQRGQFLWMIARFCYYIYTNEKEYEWEEWSKVDAFVDHLADIAKNRGMSEKEFWDLWFEKKKVIEAARLLST